MRIALALVALALPTLAIADAPGAPPSPPPEETPAPPSHDPAADGGPRYFAPPIGHDIVIESREDRSKEAVTMIAVLGGAGVITGAVGVYFHLDASSAANDVSASKFTGEVWTSEREATYDRANRSSLLAGVFYGFAGAFLVGCAVAYIVSEPPSEKMIIHPHANPKPQPVIAPTQGGAFLGGRWSF
jgi:hypothetical protein